MKKFRNAKIDQIIELSRTFIIVIVPDLDTMNVLAMFKNDPKNYGRQRANGHFQYAKLLNTYKNLSVFRLWWNPELMLSDMLRPTFVLNLMALTWKRAQEWPNWPVHHVVHYAHILWARTPMIKLLRDLMTINVFAKFENIPWKITDVRALTGLVCPATCSPTCLLNCPPTRATTIPRSSERLLGKIDIHQLPE